MGKTTSDTVLSESPSAAEACRRLGSDLSSGLDPAEAARRRQVHGPNELPSEPPTPWWHLLARQFVEPMAVLLLTGHGTADIVEEAAAMGFDAILLKPFTRDQLHAAAKQALRGHM